jgi:hypothetical protein
MAIPGMRKPPFVFEELHIYTPYPHASIKNVDSPYRIKHYLRCSAIIAISGIASDRYSEADVDNSHKELQ